MVPSDSDSESPLPVALPVQQADSPENVHMDTVTFKLMIMNHDDDRKY
jgi:hypothetical protein